MCETVSDAVIDTGFVVASASSPATPAIYADAAAMYAGSGKFPPPGKEQL